MIVRKYGLDLVRLRREHIDMVRLWRNAEQISRHMEFREEITSEMQEKWFRSIDNLNNFYFLIRSDEQFLGLIHLSHINFTLSKAYAGLFISHPEFLATTVPVRASLSMLDFAFEKLKLNTILAKVKKGNTRARLYNEKLGFSYLKEADHPDFEWLELTEVAYYKKSGDLRIMAQKTFGGAFDLIFDADLKIDGEIKMMLDN